jgi:hypothetical protein
MLVELPGINHVRKWLKKKGLWEDYYYAWKGKGAPRLKGKPGSPEFIASYHAAHASIVALNTAFPEETVGWLIEGKFLNSRYYEKLGKRTKPIYDRVIPSILNHFGTLKLEALKLRRTRALIIEWRDSIANGTCKTLAPSRGRPRVSSDCVADQHMQKFGAILNQSFKVGWIDLNPCALVGQLNYSSRLDKVWSWEQEAVFLAEGRPDLVEAYLVGVWTALREGDCVDLRVSQHVTRFEALGGAFSQELSGGFICRELEKRARPDAPPRHAMIPVVGPFKPIFEAMVRRTGVVDADPQTRASTKILRNSMGRPWANGKSFYGAFRAECERLGIHDRTFHDLRRTAIVRLAIAGCTDIEIVSITRHTLKEVKTVLEKHYLYLDPQIAINAMRKLEDSTAPYYAQFVTQFLERRLSASRRGTSLPTEIPTEPSGARFVRAKV